MEYTQLGSAGVKVSRLCLGTAFRGQKDDAVCEEVIRRAIDHGVNFFDCANFYGRGRSELFLGRAIEGRRDDLVITSKVWSRIGDGPNDAGLSRYAIIRECERSLQRLNTDRIDVYLLHNVDEETPSDEILGAMDHLVQQGKIIYAGSCNHRPWQLMEHLGLQKGDGLTPFVITQSPYNLLQRYEVEGDMFDLCRKHGVGIMTYSPLAVGLLTGLFRRGQAHAAGSPWDRNDRYESIMSEQSDAVIQKLIDVGGQIDKTPAQVAIAWILDHPEITSPILGPDTIEHFDEACGALGWALDPTHRSALDEVSAVVPQTLFA
jgi:aryl-alcohol dehydrogenase-like predicted oxidoreductase